MMNMSQNENGANAFRNFPDAMSDDTRSACKRQQRRAACALACNAQPSPQGRTRHTQVCRQLFTVALVVIQPLLQHGR